jgi:glycosyltransferase involved in cell wall biosynthesis
MARVSVIVPAYQAERHLAAALDSIVDQTYDDWEAIVADDGSTDATADVARRYDDRVRLVRSRVNRGLAATRNLALEHAGGELVALLDSDDRWLPDYLADQLACYDEARGRVGIVCCDALLEGPGVPAGARYAERFGTPPPVVDASVLLAGNPIFVSALVPRAVIAEAGGFDASLRSVEDLDLWLRIVERGYAVVYNPKALAVYRLSAGTLSTDALMMARSRQVVYRAALERGRLDAPARRAAHRALRLERAAEAVALARRDRGLAGLRTLAVNAPLLVRVAAERALSRRPA